MDIVWWTLIGLAVTWFPAGYLGSRLMFCLINSWDAPIIKDSERTLFDVGILLGWITLVLMIYLRLVWAIVKVLGYLFAPR